MSLQIQQICRRQLHGDPSGIYMINGKKVIIHKLKLIFINKGESSKVRPYLFMIFNYDAIDRVIAATSVKNINFLISLLL